MQVLSFMVAFPVPQPHRDILAQVQEDLRPPGWRITIGPHITLVAPGSAVVSIDRARSAFAEATVGFKPLQLSYPDIGSFTRRGLTTVFLKPIISEQLYELRRRLVIMASTWQDVSRSQHRPFIPHVTLVNRLPEKRAPEVAKKLVHLAPVTMQVEAVQLYAKRDKDKNWLEIN